MKAILAKMLLNEKGEVSWTKAGAALMSAGGFILAVPTMGLGIAIPVAVMTAAKAMCAIGLYIGAAGARDVLGAKGMSAPVQPKADNQG
jgi:hypothetical protein